MIQWIELPKEEKLQILSDLVEPFFKKINEINDKYEVVDLDIIMGLLSDIVYSIILSTGKGSKGIKEGKETEYLQGLIIGFFHQVSAGFTRLIMNNIEEKINEETKH